MLSCGRARLAAECSKTALLSCYGPQVRLGTRGTPTTLVIKQLQVPTHTSLCRDLCLGVGAEGSTEVGFSAALALLTQQESLLLPAAGRADESSSGRRSTAAPSGLSTSETGPGVGDSAGRGDIRRDPAFWPLIQRALVRTLFACWWLKYIVILCLK